MAKHAPRRLGCGATGENDLKTHPFFRKFDWEKIERREVAPPFKPKIVRPTIFPYELMNMRICL